ncbi:MAG: IS481 family transposase [Proteobacteria bacterium]|nr:IS481 family transposase [Pseudomonadota bacterium]
MVFWKKKKKSEEDVAPAEFRKPPATSSSGQGRKSFSLPIKLVAAKAREAGMSNKEVSQLVGASIASIDKWYRSYREKGAEGLVRQSSHHSTRKLCDKIEQKIEEYRKEHPDRGVRRISDDLRRNEGLEVGHETVRRVLNDAGLGNPKPKSKRRPPQIRRFERELPNAMWQIDIFTFDLKRMYKVYLVGMIDDHSRYIVGHGLFRQQTKESVMEVVKGSISQWGAPREILSDNGRQFVAWRGKTKFQKTLTRQGIQHVRSAPHHPMTLGKIERFWKTIWTEFLEDASFASFADARQRLDNWVAYYNHQRPHQGIGGACPADRFYGVAGDVEEAVKQGCTENALKLALGQETRPPLYLLGKLGETDVRVTRKGEDIEVKVGDVIHEIIKMGTPFEFVAEGRSNREEEANELEGTDRGREISDSGDGAEGDETDFGDLQDFWGDEADSDEGSDNGRGSSEGGPGAEETGEETQERRVSEDYGALEESIIADQGSGALED